MRGTRTLSVVFGSLLLAGLTSGVGSAAAAPGPCVAPPASDAAATYDFIHTYRSECATNRNYDRTFPDVTLATTVDGTNRLSVTTSTALAGAIASVRVNDKEFIASGGYGAALQYAFHAWQEGEAASECYNPTQAGTRLDAEGQQAPYHRKSSTSALYTMAKSGLSVRTESRPAMFMTRADTTPGWDGCHGVDFQPDRVPFSQGLSPYWLQTTVDLQPDGAQELSNVIRLEATLTSDDDAHDHFDGVLVAYLQRDFTDAFSVDPTTRVLTRRPKDSYTSKEPLARCTTDGAYCMGILTVPSAVAAGTYYYSMSRPPSPYNGMTGEDTIQITAPRGTVTRGDKVSYEVYLAVGNRQRVADTLAALQGVVADR